MLPVSSVSKGWRLKNRPPTAKTIAKWQSSGRVQTGLQASKTVLNDRLPSNLAISGGREAPNSCLEVKCGISGRIPRNLVLIFSRHPR